MSSKEDKKTSIKFTQRRKRESVVIEDENGVEQTYEIREMDGHDLSNHRARTLTRMRMHNGEVTGINDFKGLEAQLIGLCLYGPDGKRVPESEIVGWPKGLQEALHEKCEEINGMADKKK